MMTRTRTTREAQKHLPAIKVDLTELNSSSGDDETSSYSPYILQKSKTTTTTTKTTTKTAAKPLPKLATATAAPKSSVIQIRLRKKAAPYHAINTVDTVYAHLGERVKDQPAVYHVASGLSAAINRSLMEEKHTEEEEEEMTDVKVHPFLLSGVSGCGKTETVLAVKHLLGMDPGYENEEMFVSYDGSTLTNESQVTSLTGASAGHLGYKDGTSLADRLNKTLGIQPKIIYEDRFEKKCPTKSKAISETPTSTRPPPRFILLFIDELDKVSEEFLLAINGLICTGDYETPSGTVFKKPPQTSMILMFTANYGEKEINAMRERDDEAAEAYILADMRRCDVPACTIGRLGNVFPYYALEKEALHALLGLRLEQHIEGTPLVRRYGKDKKILVAQEVKDVLVNYVLRKVSSDLGVRGALRQLLRKVDLLFEKAFSELRTMYEHALFLPCCDDELALTGCCVNIRRFLNSDEERDSFIRSVIQNPANTQTIALCRNRQDDTLDLDVIGVRIGQKDLCHFVLPMPVHLSTIEEEEEEEDVSKRKMPQKKKRVVVPEESNEKKRKIDQVIIGETTKTTKKTKVVASDGQPAAVRIKSNRGVKPRKVDGFTPLHYIESAKRYLYRCDCCSANVDSRQIGNHQCAASQLNHVNILK